MDVSGQKSGKGREREGERTKEKRDGDGEREEQREREGEREGRMDGGGERKNIFPSSAFLFYSDRLWTG